MTKYLHFDKDYEDYYFPSNLLKKMVGADLYEYAKQNFKKEEYETLNNYSFEDLTIFWPGKDESYDFCYNLFEENKTIKKNDIDDRGGYIAEEETLILFCLQTALEEINKKNDFLEDVIGIEYGFDYGNGPGSGVKEYIWEKNNCAEHFKDKIQDDEMDSFLEYIYEDIGSEDENIPGVILEDVSSHDGGGYDGYYYDIYIEKKSLKKAGEFLVESGKSIIDKFLKGSE